MKKIILLSTIIIISGKGIAQKENMTVSEMDRLTGEQYSIILKKQFNAVINSSGKTTIGNYASADIKDGHLAFNATRNFTNGNMLSINANGGVADGFFAIFNQTKINSKVGFDLKYNIMLKKNSSLSFYNKELNLLESHLAKSDDEYEFNRTIHLHDSVMLQKKLALVKIEINSLANQINKGSLNDQEKARMEYELAMKNLEQDSINFKLQKLQSAKESDNVNMKRKKKDRLAAIEDFDYTAIRFQWVSIGAGFQNNNFNQFEPNFTALDNQIIKQNYTTWNIIAEWNLYNWNHYSKYTFYILVGGKFTIDDNFSDLSKVELDDTQQYSNSVTQRTITQKIVAYKGDYQTKLLSGKFYIDFYKFFLGNAAALHIYPEVNYKQNAKPQYNTGIGLLCSFIDAKDKENKAKLNAELYFKLSDLSNNTDSELSVLQRNELGLRLSIPVSFFNF
jgi:hypothetical protein